MSATENMSTMQKVSKRLKLLNNVIERQSNNCQNFTIFLLPRLLCLSSWSIRRRKKSGEAPTESKELTKSSGSMVFVPSMSWAGNAFPSNVMQLHITVGSLCIHSQFVLPDQARSEFFKTRYHLSTLPMLWDGRLLCGSVEYPQIRRTV